MDLAKLSGEEIARAIEEGIKGLDVGVLVNNAGVAYPYAKFFHEVDLEVVESSTKVNIEAAAWVSRAVLPGMLKKKKGAIANIGSGSSVIVPSYPLYTVYAASKAYLAMFSRCTSVEYKQQGIDIQCQESSLGTKRCNRKTHWGIAVNLIWKRTGSPGWLHPLYSLVFSCMELICRDWTVSLPMFTRKVARKQTVSLMAWGSFRPRE